MSRHLKAMRVALPKQELGEYILREGRARDAARIQTWPGDELAVRGALTHAMEHVRSENGLSFVTVDAGGSPVGIFTLEVPHLQFAYFVSAVRGRGVATRAAARLIEHYFGSHSDEKWLGDSGSTTDDGASFVLRLGFVEADGWRRLTRENWTRTRSALLDLSR